MYGRVADRPISGFGASVRECTVRVWPRVAETQCAWLGIGTLCAWYREEGLPVEDGDKRGGGVVLKVNEKTTILLGPSAARPCIRRDNPPTTVSNEHSPAWPAAGRAGLPCPCGGTPSALSYTASVAGLHAFAAVRRIAGGYAGRIYKGRNSSNNTDNRYAYHLLRQVVDEGKITLPFLALDVCHYVPVTVPFQKMPTGISAEGRRLHHPGDRKSVEDVREAA